MKAVEAERVGLRPVWVFLAGMLMAGVGNGLQLVLVARFEGGAELPLAGLVAVALSVALLVSPIAWYVELGLTHALAHALGAGGGSAQTRAALGFGSAPRLFSFIPVVAVATELWALVNRVRWLSRLHRLALWRACVVGLMPFAVSVTASVGLRAHVIESFKVPSASMFPVLEVGDYLFVAKWRRRPERGEVVAFSMPDRASDGEAPKFLKRALGLPGDELSFEAGAPLINGWRVPRCSLGLANVVDLEGEPVDYEVFVEFLGSRRYLVAHGQKRNDGQQGPYVVPRGELWMIGDNRSNSADSRSFRGGQGAGVPLSDVLGTAELLWLPLERLGVMPNAEPVLPASLASLKPRLEQCLAQAPDLAHTTPPAPPHAL